MQYVLGNMLNGGGGLNPDGLSLDLQFAADKTLTARRGPTPVFTRGSTGTFVGSNGLIQSAAINEPRFDHDPTSPFACRGLLIEEPRTNLFTQSETWQTGASVTGPSAPTFTQDTTNAPDGALTADTLTGSTGTATDGSVNSTWRLPTVSSSTAYTFSIYVRSLGVATKAEIRIRDNSTGASVQTLDTTLTSSWKRLSVTATTGPTTTSIRCIIQNTDGPIAIWGAQFEAGSFATSYIPTTTGTLARSADVCSITGGNFNNFYNQSEGTFLSSTQLFSIGNDYSASYWNVFNPANYMRVSVYNQTSTQEFSYLQNNDGTLNSTVVSEPSRISRTAGAYQLNNARIVKNGTLGVLDTTFTPYSNFISLTIMSQASGTINSLRYYRKRLPDAKLQALTV